MFIRNLSLAVIFASFRFLAAQQQVVTTDVSAEQMIQFMNRGFGHAEVVMGSASNWSVYSSKYSRYLSLSTYGGIDAMVQMWQTSSYVRGTNYYQRIELNELKNGKRIVKYQTNSERKFNTIQQFLLRNSEKITSGEYLFFSGLRFRYKGNTDWEYTTDNTQYDESYRTYQVVFYPADLYKYLESYYAWERVVNSGYDEEQLDDFITRFPMSPNIKTANLKLQEIKYNQLDGTGDINAIHNFIRRFPGSQYIAELRSQKEDIEYRRELNSGDMSRVYARLLTEKNTDRKMQLRRVYLELRYNDFVNRLDNSGSIDNKINFIKGNKQEFDTTVYFSSIQQKLEELEYKNLPNQEGIDCHRLQQFLQEYPSSRYSSSVRQREIKCREIVKKNRILDSANQVYAGLLNTTQYQSIIQTGEFILNLSGGRNATLEKQIKEYRELYTFILERRRRIYNLQQIDPTKYNNIAASLKSSLHDKYKEYRNLTIGTEVQYSIDTLGAVGVIVNGNCPKGFKSDIADGVAKKHHGQIFMKNMPVMVQSSHVINYVSKTQALRFVYSKNGGFSYADANAGSQTGARALTYLNNNRSSYKPGKYAVLVDDVTCNNENRMWMNVSSYRSFTGISAVLPALVLPGLGTRLVTGQKGKAWITWVTYSLVGLGLYYLNQSNNTYNDYKAATTQSEMDRLYAQYKEERGYAARSILGGAALYSVNLGYVLCKGTSNSLRTAKYRSKYKKTSNRI